jgi:4-hydroxy-tetrahydrodipicolinate synthase
MLYTTLLRHRLSGGQLGGPGITSTARYEPRGIVAAAVTPFHEDESLDEGRLESHLQFLVDSGVHGLMVIGGSGEYVNLTPAERQRVVTITMQTVGKRVPVIVGALAPSTREVLEIGLHAQREGATALLVLPPYYIKPSMDGVVLHFEKVARETGLNIIAYNNPGRTGWAMTVEQLRTITDVPGVVGLKECDRDVASISLKIAAVGERIAVLSGDDDLGFATLLSGSPGAIWASPNLTPRLCLDLYAACQAGDVPKALALHNRLVHIVSAWFIPNHPGPLKEAMALIGRSVGPARLPLARMTSAQRDALAETFRTYGPIE